MRTENINHAFLDGVLDGTHEDVYYHFGVASSDPLLTKLRDVKAVVMAGSAGRIKEFAERWSELNAGTEIVAFPKEDRFVTRYTAGVLFASHGMGMPSASIALQELMRLVFFLKRRRARPRRGDTVDVVQGGRGADPALSVGVGGRSEPGADRRAGAGPAAG